MGNEIIIECSPLQVIFPRIEESGKETTITIPSPIKILRNKITLINGPSGSGKSTLLALLKGIIPHSVPAQVIGSIVIEGIDILKNISEECRQKIFYVFQNPYSQLVCPYVKEELVFSMENLLFPDRLINLRLAEMSCFFGLEAILEQRTDTLSGGECQKVVLASSLAARPLILLLDEPTAFLDKAARDEFYKYLRNLKGKYTIVMVDHYYQEVIDFVDEIVNFNLPTEVIDVHRTANLDLLPQFESTESTCSPPRQLMIEIKNLRYTPTSDKKSAADNFLLKDINLSLTSGNITGIIGKNGSGKTTLLKLFSGIIPPKCYQGDVTMFEPGTTKTIIPRGKWPNYVSYLMQNPESHFIFDSIWEELTNGSKVTPHSLMEEYFTNFMGEHIDLTRSPFLLSEGEKRRLTVLCSMLEKKSVIFYDEPTFGQDQQRIQEIKQMVKYLKSINRLQLLVTHDLNFANDVCDQIYELCDGRLVSIENK